MTPLVNSLSLTPINNAFIMSQWYMSIPMLYEKGIYSVESIAPAIAKKYTFDFYGLLVHEFNVPAIYLYPHLLVNNLAAPTDYDGTTLSIRLLDTSILSSYYTNFNK